MTKGATYLFEGPSWDADLLRRIYDAIEPIALEDLGLSIYPNQRRIVSSEQMLDAYTSHAMPHMYGHWSFGKHYALHEHQYRRSGSLAYEVVINSDPCVSYYHEKNTAAMQTLVTAHAAFGHNHFFKNNHVFQEWTDAEATLDYFRFAQTYIAKCEVLYGEDAVARILTAAHALSQNGIFTAKRPPKVSEAEKLRRKRRQIRQKEEQYDDLWHATLPPQRDPFGAERERAKDEKNGHLVLPEENLLYFLEKYSPNLQNWEREIIRIVRVMAQYFYPQMQTKLMNEAFATFTHYYIVNELWEKGLITDGARWEALVESHTNVLTQREWNQKGFGGINWYKLGYEMLFDMRRISEDPTPEDNEWFPTFAGKGSWKKVILDAMELHRDESFILQFLSPRLIRKFRFFAIEHSGNNDHSLVTHIQNEEGYRDIRRLLAAQHDIASMRASPTVEDVDFRGNRSCLLRHRSVNGALLLADEAVPTLTYFARLWKHSVRLESVNENGEVVGGWGYKKKGGVYPLIQQG